MRNRKLEATRVQVTGTVQAEFPKKPRSRKRAAKRVQVTGTVRVEFRTAIKRHGTGNWQQNVF